MQLRQPQPFAIPRRSVPTSNVWSLDLTHNVRSQRVAERLGAILTETVTPAHSSRATVVWRHQHIV